MDVIDGMRMRGRFTLTVRDPDGSVVAEASGDNTMCTVGYNVWATAALWSCAIDQNQNQGLLLTPAYAAPVYGAVGSGTAATGAADTQLQAELGRTVLYSGSTTASPPSFSLDFFFGTSASPWVIGEAGVFLQATSATNNGSLLDHAQISPTVTKGTAQTATLSVTFNLS